MENAFGEFKMQEDFSLTVRGIERFLMECLKDQDIAKKEEV